VNDSGTASHAKEPHNLRTLTTEAESPIQRAESARRASEH
jgi:hypothetical protein